jgi:hypothetical protein
METVYEIIKDAMGWDVNEGGALDDSAVYDAVDKALDKLMLIPEAKLILDEEIDA